MPKLRAIGIVVKDMQTSLDFYRKLGLDLPIDPGTEDHVETVLDGGIRLMFDTEELVRGFDPDWKRPDSNSIGLAFECDSASEVNSVHESFIETGYVNKSNPWDAFWGQRYAQLLDPDGHAVDLFAPL